MKLDNCQGRILLFHVLLAVDLKLVRTPLNVLLHGF